MSDYFSWQKPIGEIGGEINKFLFKDYIRHDSAVIDFGCGGGYLLVHMKCKSKIGVEINNAARKMAEQNGIKTVASIDEIEDTFADVIVSNHALEHVENPLQVLRNLQKKLKQGGTIIIVVPHEGPKQKYDPADINQHLFTWNRQTIGNLLAAAGYKNIVVSHVRHSWTLRSYSMIYNYLGPTIFDLVCLIYSRLKGIYQIKVVAQK